MYLSCFHPLAATYVLASDGKKIIRFCNSLVDVPKKGETRSDFLWIPCGQCVGCRMDYAYQWTNRLLCELETSVKDDCHFVTLTYDDPHLIEHCRPATDLDTGEFVEPPIWSLNKRDVQLFMKRLRKAFPDQRIRFYLCGEYGGENHRPHYHLILFNLHLPDGDLIAYKRSQLGYAYYNSRSIALAWPFGFNVVAPVTPESCGYTARYMLKKQKGEDSFVYYNYDLEPPFTLCSRKPGIGFEFYRSVLKGSLDDNKIVLSTERGSRQFFAPKYFEKLFESDYPQEAIARKERRKQFAVEKNRIELLATDLDQLEYLAVKESSLQSRISILNDRSHFSQ